MSNGAVDALDGVMDRLVAVGLEDELFGPGLELDEDGEVETTAGMDTGVVRGPDEEVDAVSSELRIKYPKHVSLPS